MVDPRSRFLDTFVFTGQCLILIDVQCMTGKKVSYQGIPCSKINRIAVETAGSFVLYVELRISIGGDPMLLSKQLNKKVKICDLQKVLTGM